MSLNTQTAQEEPAAEDWELPEGHPAAETPAAEGEDGEEQSEEAAAPAAPQLSETEQLAVEMGWKPKHEWKGDQSGWTPATEFIRNMPKVLKRTQEHNREERRRAEDLEDRLYRLERTNEEVRRQEHARIRWEYEQAKFKAAENGDADLWNRLNSEQQEFEEKNAPQQSAPQPVDAERVADETLRNPALMRFYTDNSWILQADDDGPYEYAVQIANDVVARGGTQVDAIARAQEALRYAFPQMYEAKPAPHERVDRDPATGQFTAQQSQQPQQMQRRGPAPVANGQRAATKDTGVAAQIARLPEEAKRAMEAEVARGFKREDWLKIYNDSKRNS